MLLLVDKFFWLVGCFRCCCCWINFFDGKKYKICWLEATTRSFFAFNRHSTDVFMSIIFISENRKTKIFDVLMMIIIFLLVILFETINSIFCLMRKIKLYFFPTYLIFMFFFSPVNTGYIWRVKFKEDIFLFLLENIMTRRKQQQKQITNR